MSFKHFGRDVRLFRYDPVPSARRFACEDEAYEFVSELDGDRGDPFALRRALPLDALDAGTDMCELRDADVKRAAARALATTALVALEDRPPSGGPRRPGKDPEPPREPDPHPAPPRPDQRVSFYEIVVVDERDAPLSRLPVVVTTPACTVRQPTDAGGRIRVDQAPPGFGSARIASVEDFAKVTAGSARAQRRSAPLPAGGDWHVRTPERLLEPVALPDAEPQRLMLVTRTDYAFYAKPNAWHDGAATNAGPWLETGTQPLSMQLHADGTRSRLELSAPELCGEPYSRRMLGGSTGEPKAWCDIDVDGLHRALFDGDFDVVRSLLAAIPSAPLAEAPIERENGS